MWSKVNISFLGLDVFFFSVFNPLIFSVLDVFKGHLLVNLLKIQPSFVSFAFFFIPEAGIRNDEEKTCQLHSSALATPWPVNGKKTLCFWCSLGDLEPIHLSH